ncbi:MAG: DUF2911 domain-containing protein [Gemmatimonadaceae bacterium]
MRRLTLSLCLLSTFSGAALSQSTLKAAPSGRASTEVTLSAARVQGQPAPTPLKIRIEYGQPHARGRAVAGALAGDLGNVWRLGANEATSFTTPVDLTVGTLTIPKGEYTLFVETSKAGEWKLIVNKRTKEWGTDYDAKSDLGRVALTSRTLVTPIESLSIWLIPSGDGAPKGELRFGWGTREFSVPWSVK